VIIRVLILIIILSSSLQAQVVTTNDSVRLLQKRVLSAELLCVGASMPFKDFGDREKSTTSGFAIPGIKLDAGFNIQLYKHLGIKSSVMWQNNQIDQTKFKKDLEAENSANSYSVSSGGWNNFSILIGAFSNFNVGSSYHIQPYILGGFNLGFSPKVDVIVSDTLEMISSITQKRGHATNFCYGAGIDFKADLDNNLQFIVGVNGFYSALKFNGIRVENTYKNSVYEFTAYQSIQTLGFKIGIAKILR
jgi:hypothetical protein